MNMNVKSVAEVKEIASQLGRPGSPCIKLEVRNIEVSVDCTVELYYNIELPGDSELYCHATT